MDFCAGCNVCGIGRVCAEQTAANVGRTLSAADVNHDGKLTREEAQAGMPPLAAHFDEIDITHKGYVTLEQVGQFAAPGAFVKRDAVQKVQDSGILKRLVFKDGSSLDVRYDGPCRDLYEG